jgi:hypothetical protein
MLAADDLKGLEELAPSFFNDSGQLEQVAFSRYQVILKFERLTVDLFCISKVRGPHGEHWEWLPERDSDMKGFTWLLESPIRGYEITPASELILRFANGFELTIANDDGAFEALILTGTDGLPLVVH